MSNTDCPRAGSGVHRWLLSEANRCRRRGVQPHAAAYHLRDAVQGCGRRVDGREIVDAVRRAYGSVVPSMQVRSASRWPAVNHSAIRECEQAGGLADLWEASRVRLDSNTPRAEEIVPTLFPGNNLLCCAWSQSRFETKPLSEWRGSLARLQFIVPSPMTKRVGVTRDGRESSHTLDNTGPRRFLVCEFDEGTLDSHAGRLLWLARKAPLVCAVYSGGKSLHGWFLVDGQPEAKVTKFFTLAVERGADPATWNRSQFVRMPDGCRDDGRWQATYYLNFNPILSHD